MTEWIVYQWQTTTRTYVGIEAESRDGAIRAFYKGEGDLDIDREHHEEWTLDAVSVAAGSLETDQDA